eukprot:568979-Amphidinium_carterae.1
MMDGANMHTEMIRAALKLDLFTCDLGVWGCGCFLRGGRGPNDRQCKESQSLYASHLRFALTFPAQFVRMLDASAAASARQSAE